MSGISIKFAGDEQIIRNLTDIDARMRKNAVKRAVRAAVKPMVRDFRANVPVRFGFLRKAVTSKVDAYSSGTVAGIIGARSNLVAVGTDSFGNRINVRPSRYLHLVEFGTNPHMILMPKRTRGPKVMHHRGTRAYRPLTRAFEANKAGAMVIIETTLREFIDNGV